MFLQWSRHLQIISRPVTNHIQPLILRLSAVTLVEGTAPARFSRVPPDFFLPHLLPNVHDLMAAPALIWSEWGGNKSKLILNGLAGPFSSSAIGTATSAAASSVCVIWSFPFIKDTRAVCHILAASQGPEQPIYACVLREWYFNLPDPSGEPLQDRGVVGRGAAQSQGSLWEQWSRFSTGQVMRRVSFSPGEDPSPARRHSWCLGVAT